MKKGCGDGPEQWFVRYGLGTSRNFSRPFQGCPQDQNSFHDNAQRLFAFLFSPSQKRTVEFSRGCVTCGYVIFLTSVSGMCACVFLCYNFFSVLIPNMVNRYKPHKKRLNSCPAQVLPWLECHPVHQKASGLVSDQCAHLG